MKNRISHHTCWMYRATRLTSTKKAQTTAVLVSPKRLWTKMRAYKITLQNVSVEYMLKPQQTLSQNQESKAWEHPWVSRPNRSIQLVLKIQVGFICTTHEEDNDKDDCQQWNVVKSPNSSFDIHTSIRLVLVQKAHGSYETARREK